MRGRAFVDTNIWVYTVDAADPERRRRALEVVGPDAHEDLVVSSQVLAEFYSVVTRKLASPLDPAAASALAGQIALLPVVPVDGQLVLSAVAASREWGVSIWDALIIRAAEAAGCDIVLSEDLSHGRAYGSVSVVNPFCSAA
jgi:predicted nucleic acid-binding protein